MGCVHDWQPTGSYKIMSPPIQIVVCKTCGWKGRIFGRQGESYSRVSPDKLFLGPVVDIQPLTNKRLDHAMLAESAVEQPPMGCKVRE